CGRSLKNSSERCRGSNLDRLPAMPPAVGIPLTRIAGPPQDSLLLEPSGRPTMARRDDDDDDDDRPRRRRPRYNDDDDDDDRPRSRRSSSRDQDEDDYADAPRPRNQRKSKPKQTDAVGATALAIAMGALVVAVVMPCLASFSLVPAGIGIVVGFIGLVIAQKSDGQQGTGLPITALSISAAAILIAVGWLFLGKKVEKKIEQIGAEAEAQAAKEEAKRKKDVATAAREVKAAGPDGVIQITAEQLARAYEQN